MCVMLEAAKWAVMRVVSLGKHYDYAFGGCLIVVDRFLIWLGWASFLARVHFGRV